ncbi:hypothetical protein CL628_00625 [bacterium]|nr:hypothetical protein [bacterium]
MSWKTPSLLLHNTAVNALNRTQLVYLTEPADWVIRETGRALAGGLSSAGGPKMRISAATWGIRNSVIHFGSLHTMLWQQGIRQVHSSNRAIGTIFHLIPGAARNQHLPALMDSLQLVHTACTLTKRALIESGMAGESIRVIPLGVDPAVYSPASDAQRDSLREQSGIPPDAFVVGSFQKDGIGWEAGMAPKPEKGPDVLVATIVEAAKHLPIHVLLVGPARGYVMNELERCDIPYTAIGHVSTADMVAQYYHALDAYLISSRIEGGPKALLESWASGIPVVTTNVGMVPDLAEHGRSALVSQEIDPETLAESLVTLARNPSLAQRLASFGRVVVQAHAWPRIAGQYYDQLYRPLDPTL